MLAKTRSALTQGIKGLFSGGAKLDDDVFDDLEEQLIMADMGLAAAGDIMTEIRARGKADRISNEEDLKQALVELIASGLSIQSRSLDKPSADLPLVILMVGVNGVGKTTTTAKLANYFKSQDKNVMLAAGDTFRAAAIEQLQQWGQRMNIPVITQPHGSDAAAVAHDALSAAIARNADVLLIDTAGRQHTASDLMEQLKKVVRVLKKQHASVPHEVLLTVDAGNGQNTLSQTEHFSNAVGVTGLCVTKLDGTAKGGVTVALVKKFGLPIRFIGVGEGVDDLRVFEPTEFAQAMINDEG